MFTFYLLLAAFLSNAQKENLSTENKQDSSGKARSSASIRLRCPATIQNTNVLYIIDGILNEQGYIEFNIHVQKALIEGFDKFATFHRFEFRDSSCICIEYIYVISCCES